MGNCQQNVKVLDELGTQSGQSHLMNHWKNLPSYDKRKTFQQQLNKVNVSQTIKIFKTLSYSSGKSTQLGSSRQSDRNSGATDFRPIPQQKIIKKQQIAEHKGHLDQLGYKAIKNGEVAVFIMSGNQSPELNMDFPIGTYDLGLDSACSIFQILVRKLEVLSKISGAGEDKKVKLYIMTSTENKNDIKNHFKQKNYFGYGMNNVFFFSQTSEPVVDQNGKILLKSESDIYTNPRGNGAIYSQIKQKKLIDHLSLLGIKYIFLGPINNILLKVADPCTLGLLIQQKNQIVATCVDIQDDCFGYFGLADDKQHIKVYQQKPLSQYKRWANTGACYLTFQFLNSLINNPDFIKKIKQEFHEVVKKAVVFDTSTNTRKQTKCLYFQNFYHEAFLFTNKISIVQVDAVAEFAPVRSNGKSKYSITYARDALWNWHRIMLGSAGVNFVGEGHIEIHPSLTYEGQNIDNLIKQKYIKSTIKLPQFIN